MGYIPSAQSNGSATGTITANGQSVSLALPAGTSGTGFQFTGTFAGTVTFETSQDGGTTYNIRVYRGAGTLNNLQTSTSTFPSEWRGNSAHMTHVRVRCTAYTSGTLNVAISSSQGSGAVFLNAAIPIGGESSGNTSTANIAGSGSFTGTYEVMEHVASIVINLIMNQSGTLRTQYSQDGSTLFSEVTYPVTAATPFYLTLTPRAQYFRLKLDNGSGSTSTVSLETSYRAVATDLFRAPLGSTTLLKDGLLAPPVRAIGTFRQSADTYVDQTGDSVGNAYVSLAASTTVAGLLTTRNAALTNTAAAVKASGGRLYGYNLFNTNSTDVFVHFYDAATGSVTVGTTTPKLSIGIIANTTVDVVFAVPVTFSTAITWACSTTATGGTAPGTAIVVNGYYI